MGMSDRDLEQYRPCVGVMLVDGEGKAFVGKRIDNKEGDFWQMPQGGVDPGEDPGAAVLREFYDLPDDLKGKLWGGCYVGQRQAWYLARFTGEDGDIDLDAHDPPEFCEWKWVEPALLPELIVPFKREVYAAVVAGFREYL